METSIPNENKVNIGSWADEATTEINEWSENNITSLSPSAEIERDSTNRWNLRGNPRIISDKQHELLNKKLHKTLMKTKARKLQPAPNLRGARGRGITENDVQDKINQPPCKQAMPSLDTGPQVASSSQEFDLTTRISQDNYSVQTSNKFAPLADIAMDTDRTTDEEFVTQLRFQNTNRGEDRETSARKEIPSQTRRDVEMTIGGDDSSNSHQQRATTKASRKEERPPPLNILYQNPKDTEKLISGQLQHARFTIKRINNSKHSLQMLSLLDFYKAKKLLESVKACFYTFTPKKDKVITMLLKGLHHSYDPQEILKELQALNIEGLNFVKVTQFKTKRSSSENMPLSMFMVQLDASSQLHKLQKVTRLCHHVTTWEKLRNKDIIQCKRCQRIGHVASNCNMNYRCVKCNLQHEPGNCAIASNTLSDKSKIYCVNCKQFGHPASYRGCPVLIELKRKKLENKELLQVRRERKIAVINSYVKKNISFADMIKNNNIGRPADPKNINYATNNASRPPLVEKTPDPTFMTSLMQLFSDFKNQVLELIQKQQDQINGLVTLAENTEKKTNYVLNILDSLNS